jgi:phage gpG-like protein
MGEVAVDQLARMKTRTLAGKDFEEVPFAPYSESYADFRSKKGRPTDKVDLFFKGHMFGSMDWETIDGGVRLFFNDAQQAAKAHGLHHGYLPHRLPARPFFEMSDEDADKIREQVEDAVEEMREYYPQVG